MKKIALKVSPKLAAECTGEGFYPPAKGKYELKFLELQRAQPLAAVRALYDRLCKRQQDAAAHNLLAILDIYFFVQHANITVVYSYVNYGKFSVHITLVRIVKPSNYRFILVYSVFAKSNQKFFASPIAIFAFGINVCVNKENVTSPMLDPSTRKIQT